MLQLGSNKNREMPKTIENKSINPLVEANDEDMIIDDNLDEYEPETPLRIA